jgi:hypothetical protein
MTILQLRNDKWLRIFWRNCPLRILEFVASNVVPTARQNLEPAATHQILLDLEQTAFYRSVTQPDRHRLHSLVGRVVRVARNFEVETTPDGNPKRVRVTDGQHKSITIQRPPR